MLLLQKMWTQVSEYNLAVGGAVFELSTGAFWSNILHLKDHVSAASEDLARSTHSHHPSLLEDPKSWAVPNSRGHSPRSMAPAVPRLWKRSHSSPKGSVQTLRIPWNVSLTAHIRSISKTTLNQNLLHCLHPVPLGGATPVPPPSG